VKQITKKEALYLAKKGFQWGNMLHCTHSVGHKYYVTESPKILKVLEEYQNSQKSEE